MGKKKEKQKQKKKHNLHYDPNSFFLDDVLKEVEERYKERKEKEISY